MRRRVLAGVVGVAVGCAALFASFADGQGNGRVASCGFGPDFSPTAVHSRTGAELGTDPAAKALLTFLRSFGAQGPTFGLPLHGWKVLRRDANTALYGHSDGLGPVGHAVLMRHRRGKWENESWGGCTPSLVRAGFEIPHFRLARDATFDHLATSLKIVLNSGTCFPDRPDPIADVQSRLDHVEIVRSRDAVIVTVYLRSAPRAADGTCPGKQLYVPIVVTLEQALGHRALRDGSIVPPRLVRAAPQ